MERKKFQYKNNIIIISTMLIIFVLCIMHIDKQVILRGVHDEFGYWGIAAYFAGYDWSEAISQVPFYSYGYSFILAIIFKIFDDPQTMYQVASIINAMFVAFNFLIAYKCFEKIFKTAERMLIYFCTLFVTLYPSFIAQSANTLCESLLVFLLWLLFYMFIHITDNPSYKNIIIFGLILGYAYMVHLRVVVIYIASLIIFSLMLIMKKIDIKKYAVLIGMLIGTFALQMVIKDWIQAQLWTQNSVAVSVNDYSSRLGYLSILTSYKGIKSLLKEICGQVVYLSVSTYMLVWIPVAGLFVELLQKIYETIKNKVKFEFSEDLFIWSWTVLSFIGIVSMGSISIYEPSRLDHLFYGRYNEMLVGPIMCLALVKLYQMNCNRKRIAVAGLSISGMLIMAIVSGRKMMILPYKNEFAPMTAISLNIFRNENDLNYGFMIAVILALFFILYYFIGYLKNKKMIYGILIGLTIMFIFNSQYVLNTYIFPEQEKRATVYEIVDLMNENIPVYGTYLQKWWLDINMDFTQFALGKETLHYVSEEELCSIDGDHYYVSSTSYCPEEIKETYTVVGANDYITLWRSK